MNWGTRLHSVTSPRTTPVAIFSTYTCCFSSGSWGCILQSDRVRILVEGHEYHGAAACRNAVFRPVAPEEHGWEILSSRPQQATDVFFGQFEARVGDCEGLLEIEVDEIDQAPDLYSAPQLGKVPYFFLDRQFSSSDCAAIDRGGCGDRFVVQIHPVE
jgi:hypothetical protein